MWAANLGKVRQLVPPAVPWQDIEVYVMSSAPDYTGYSKKAARDLNHIPGDYGLPVVGYTVDFFRDLPGLVERKRRQYGDVFRMRDMFQRSIYLIGPDANEFLLRDSDKNFSSKLAWDSVLDRLFTNGLMLRDFDNHRFHRRILQEAFKKPVLQAYTERMNPVFANGIRNWPQNGYFDFFTAVKSLLLDTATAIFLGEELGPQATQVNRSFVDLVDASLAIFRVPLPGTTWARGLAARRFLEQFFASRIASKRSNGGNDFFSKICQAVDEDGNRLSDKDIVDHMIFLLFAAHDTTTSTLSSIVYELTRNPQWQTVLRDEMASINGDSISYDELDALEKTGWVFRETLRMHPPLPVIPRRALRECEFKGFRIPKNAGVMIHPLYTHYMSEYWSNPTTFDPERWSPERNEAKGHFYQFVPFGGGAHKCLGLNFAEIQSKTFLFHLLRNYRIEMQPQHNMKYSLVPLAVPSNGLPVRLMRVSTPQPVAHADPAHGSSGGRCPFGFDRK
jgi:cytochrome P450